MTQSKNAVPKNGGPKNAVPKNGGPKNVGTEKGWPEKGGQPRRVAIIVFPGFQSLDAIGPMQVFATANGELRRQGREIGYTVEAVGLSPGAVGASSGLCLLPTRCLSQLEEENLDTVLVAGGNGIDEAVMSTNLVSWIKQSEPKVRRLGSVCTGVFALAEAGLLDGRPATTHWARLAELRQRFPEVEVRPDLRHTFQPDGENGHIFTSAGVMAGMELALALLGADFGADLVETVGKRLELRAMAA